MHILFAAVLLLAGCTKLEINDKRGESPISFRPVGRMMTKAILEGSVFPDDQTFLVGGYYNSSATYFEGLEASSVTVDGVTLWGTDPIMYWPLSGRLDFIAYSPANVAAATGATITVDPADGISATGYTNDGDTDFMYAISTVNDCDAHPDAVPMTFEHALTQLVIKVKQEQDYDSDISGYSNIVRMTVNDLTLSGIYNSGNFDQSATPKWTLTGNTTSFSLSTSGLALDNRASEPVMLSRTLMLPQSLSTAVISGSYTIQQTITLNGDLTGETTTVKTFTLPITIPLSSYGSEWSPGYKYIYTLSFGLESIQVSARTSDWLPGGDEITIEEE